MWELVWIRHWVAGASHSIVSEPPPPQSTWYTTTTDGRFRHTRQRQLLRHRLRTLSNHGVTQEDAGIQEPGWRDRNLEIGNQGLDYKPGILIYYIFYYVHLAYKE